MATFPISGNLRESLLILEVVLVVIMLEAGIIFSRKVVREKKKTSTNNMLLGWAIFIFFYAIVFMIYIYSDFYVLGAIERERALNVSYIIALIGAANFAYYTEREIGIKKHFFTLIISGLTVFLVINAIFSILESSVYITFVTWLIFLVLIVFYIRRFTHLISDKWRLNVYSLIIGTIMVVLGFGGSSDWMIEALGGFWIRFVGDLLVILGIVFVSVLFIGIPSLMEFEWHKKIRYLNLIHQRGVSIAHFQFNEELGRKIGDMDEVLMAGGLTSVAQIIPDLIHSGKKLDSVDHGDICLLFAYSSNLINILVVEEPLEILRTKLKKVTNLIEFLYGDQLATWDGDLNIFPLIGPIVNANFKPRKGKSVIE